MAIIAKSIILDIADDFGGSADWLYIREVEFYLSSAPISMTSGFTAYATTTFSGEALPANTFNTSLSKTGTWVDNSWLSAAGSNTNQRLIIVFDAPLEFDKIVINNGHHNGGFTDEGIKNTVITASDDAITNTTYEAAISNSTVLFDGVIPQHVTIDAADDVTIYPEITLGEIKQASTWYSDNDFGDPANLEDSNLATYVQKFTYCCGDFVTAFNLHILQIAVHIVDVLDDIIGMTFQGSNDTTNGSDGSWNTLITFTAANLGVPESYPGWCRVMLIDNGTAYRYYRLTGGDTVDQVINEWLLTALAAIEPSNAVITVMGQSVVTELTLNPILVGNAELATNGQNLELINLKLLPIAKTELILTGNNLLVRTLVSPEFELEELDSSPVTDPDNDYIQHWHNDGTIDPEWDFVEQVSLPVPYHEHPTKPEVCGHWHKQGEGLAVETLPWWQPSIDVFENYIGLVSLSLEEENGSIINMNYSISSNSWVSYGSTDVNIYKTIPNTGRLSGDLDNSNNYMAYYCICYDDSFYNLPGGDPLEDVKYGRLFIFQSGQSVRQTDVWVSNGITTLPYWIDEDNHLYNVMDCVGDRIACLAFIYTIDSVDLYEFRVKISEDAGLTFPQEIIIPGSLALYSTWKGYLRMSNDGTIWLGLIGRESSSIHTLELWKYNEGTEIFDLIWDTDYFLDTAIDNSLMSFDVSSLDGEYISFSLEFGTQRFLYSSSNYGISFSTVTVTTADSSYTKDLHTAEKDNINILVTNSSEALPRSGFNRSTDGTTFSFLEPNSNMGTFVPDLQHNLERIVYAECGTSYTESTFQDLLFSLDNGATWTILGTELSLVAGTTVTSSAGHDPRWEFTKIPNVD